MGESFGNAEVSSAVCRSRSNGREALGQRRWERRHLRREPGDESCHGVRQPAGRLLSLAERIEVDGAAIELGDDGAGQDALARRCCRR